MYCSLLLFIILCIIIAIIYTKHLSEQFNTKTVDDYIHNNKYKEQSNSAYNELLSQNKIGVSYYYNDYYNLDNVTQNSKNIIYGIDDIDFSKLKKSGYDKCLENCKGLCTTWYDGNAECYPLKLNDS